MTLDRDNPEFLRKFLACCEESFCSVLTQALGSEWKGKIEEGNDALDGANQFRIEFSATGALNGDIEVQLSPADALTLASAFLGETSEWNNEAQEALEELLRQVVGDLATRLKSYVGEVSIKHETAGHQISATNDSSQFWFRANGANKSSIRIGIRIDPELMNCLQRGSEKDGNDTTSVLSPARTDKADSERNLGLLMGVEVPAVLRFGQRQMLLRDVLDLNTGAVIELDRQVQDPVELMLDGKVIARGEMVVVDGNYGLRVTEVASERARSEFVR